MNKYIILIAELEKRIEGYQVFINQINGFKSETEVGSLKLNGELEKLRKVLKEKNDNLEKVESCRKADFLLNFVILSLGRLYGNGSEYIYAPVSNSTKQEKIQELKHEIVIIEKLISEKENRLRKYEEDIKIYNIELNKADYYLNMLYGFLTEINSHFTLANDLTIYRSMDINRIYKDDSRAQEIQRRIRVSVEND